MIKNSFFGKNGVIDQAFGDVFKELGEAFSFPDYNILESNDNFRLEFYVPGAKKDQFDLGVDGEELKVSYKAEKHEIEGYKFNRKAYERSSFEKNFKLPQTVDVESLDASYVDGVLVVVLPKQEKAKKKNFSVKIK